MLPTHDFGTELKKRGFDFYSGVPCSFLKYLINYAINACEYIMAANEGDAVAIASGAVLGGRKGVVLMQNSGLTNATSPLTSLNYTFQLPVLGFVSLRGEPGVPDEPQHELMGQITEQMLSLMQVKWAYLSADFETAKAQLAEADTHIQANQTFFFVVQKGTFEEVRLEAKPVRKLPVCQVSHSETCTPPPTRAEALQCLIEQTDADTLLLATTGKTGRELFDSTDRPNHLYMVGSMGCVSSLALGLALARPDKPVIAIDGDGAALMRLGALATNAYYQPPNLLHLLLDNQCHDSTGGQATVSPGVDFATLAASVSYPVAKEIHTLTELADSVRHWRQQPALTFVHLRIAQGPHAEPGRPTIKPPQVKERFIEYSKTNSFTHPIPRPPA